LVVNGLVSEGVEFGLLGPLLVRRNGLDVPVPRGNQRVILATLLLRANQIVRLEHLAEAVWGSEPPTSAWPTVRNYVKRLRHVLGNAGLARITTQPYGYKISVDADELDVSRFEARAAAALEAARNSMWQEAAAEARAGLSLWRGEPLADVESEVLALREVPRLAEMRLQVLEARLDADLHMGAHAEMVHEVQRLVCAHPLREHLHALLMLALYRCGRQAEALAVYSGARRVLVEELGTEPGAELRELHQRMLAADPALVAPEREVATTGGPLRVVPRLLPASVRYFTGRDSELAVLTEMLETSGGKTPGTVMISAISGMAGVGKTALAVYWGHQVAQHFPDGQLYVNLRGFDPSGTAVTPSEAIRGFLAALGVRADRIPSDLAAQAGLYRSMLAGRQMLVLLDNARDEQQVRPLLSTSPGCLVLITSRNTLAGLAVIDSAHLLVLDVPTTADARQMLATRLGAQRATAEPAAVTEITDLCARMPLALAVAAARAATRPRLPLAALAAEFRDTRSRLDILDTGDPAASVRAVFSWSIQQLSPAGARMFRLLGLHPGPDITDPAAASLAGIPLGEGRQAITELTRAHLLIEHAHGRYAFHDLLRVYAADQAGESLDPETQHEAVGRMLDHYLHTAHAAAVAFTPTRDRIILTPPRPGVTPEPVADRQKAQAWFEAEYHVLGAAVTVAARAGFDAHAWQLPWALAHFLEMRGLLHEQATHQCTALRAATRLGDKAGQASAHRFLGSAFAMLGEHDKARDHLTDCLRLYEELGDQAGQARMHHSFCWIASLEGRHADALCHAEQVLELARAAGNQTVRAGALQADALNAIGWNRAMLGDYQQARAICRRALAQYRRLGHLLGQATSWDSLGYAEDHLGRHAQAIACYRNAVQYFSEAGSRSGEAEALTHLGDACRAVGRCQEATEAWTKALAILDDLHHPDADQVRTRLATIEDRSAANPS
jgi:DNA-binding SARP family transcriptional activator/tetratricopeptide (TPR) repeat protein